MLKNIQIRNMILQDYEKILEMLNDLHVEHVSHRPDIYLPSQEAISHKEFSEIVCSSEYIARVAVSEQEIVGFAVGKVKMTPEDPLIKSHKTVYIDEIYVLPAFRKNKVGKELLSCLEAVADEINADRIDLNVWSFNKDAINFYEKVGMSIQRVVFEKKLK